MNNNLMTVERLIAAIVNKYFTPNGINYLFMDWTQTNVEIDRLNGPTIAYILPPSGTLSVNLRRQRVYDAPQAQIAFMAPTDFDFESGANDNIIENMKRLAIAFITAVNISGDFEEIDQELDYQVIYDYLDENVTGIIISPILKEKEGIGVCPSEIDTTDDLFDTLFGYNIIAKR